MIPQQRARVLREDDADYLPGSENPAWDSRDILVDLGDVDGHSGETRPSGSN